MSTVTRRQTVTTWVGPVPVGSAHPIVVQSMTNTDTADVEATASQVAQLAAAGSELVRVTVNHDEAAAAVPRIVERLEALKARHRRIRQVRGMGLLIGVEIDGNAREVVQRCMARGFLVLTAGDSVVRFTPPLIITEADVDRGVAILDEVLAEVLA